jgi:hypothetical protein
MGSGLGSSLIRARQGPPGLGATFFRSRGAVIGPLWRTLEVDARRPVSSIAATCIREHVLGIFLALRPLAMDRPLQQYVFSGTAALASTHAQASSIAKRGRKACTECRQQKVDRPLSASMSPRGLEARFAKLPNAGSMRCLGRPLCNLLEMQEDGTGVHGLRPV